MKEGRLWVAFTDAKLVTVVMNCIGVDGVP